MWAKKSLGQNFLRDVSVCKRIVAALDLQKADTVIEIGPGQGALTAHLLDSVARVIAIEFDRDLISPLRVQFNSYDNLGLINVDALTVDLEGLVDAAQPAKLVANLPYNISTPILQRLIDQRMLFSRIVLMFQREVVERITASPGKKERGFLSVLTEGAFDVEYLFDVPPTVFVPVPKVWSAVVRLTPKETSVNDPDTFRKIVSVSFAQKRRTIQNNLKTLFPDAALILDTAGIDPGRRAETLTLEEWRRLTGTVSEKIAVPAIN